MVNKEVIYGNGNFAPLECVLSLMHTSSLFYRLPLCGDAFPCGVILSKLRYVELNTILILFLYYDSSSFN